MAEAVVSMALETLRDLLLEEAKFLHGVSSEVKGLETQLKEIKCLLEDADKRQHESKTISNWVSEIRDLAHRAEDTIETYAVQISSTTRGPGFKKLLRRISCLNECFSLHQIGSEISEIKSEIARIKESMKEFGIRSIIQGEIIENENQRWKRQTYPIENEDCFVGKEDDLKKLVSLVVDDKQQRVIAIWGMGGIGKTTIARKVYNDNDTKRSFECFAWVCITQQCQIRSVLEDVLKQLIPQKGDAISSLTNTQLIEQLCQIQKTKRCMIVLDDLWEVDHFNGLKNAFLVQGSNSKVLVTTRKQNVADMGFAFELGLLKIDDGWELLKKKAFPFNNIPDNFGMEEKQFQEIGKEMVCKCGYLPLVISILGGLLSKRKSMEEWEAVHKNINAHLYREENEIHGVLNLSYEDLAFYLKPCFLFMAQFREDEYISAIDLLRMWIAEGMISHQSQDVHDNKSLLAIINASITNWTKLKSFHLDIESGCQLTSTEEGLMIFKNVFSCQILHRLCIRVPITRLQLEETVAEIITSRLVDLYLRDCQIEDDPMEILGMFPVLEILYLDTRAFVGKKMKCQALGFPNLKKLTFEELPNLGEWIIEQGAMPLLSEIEIDKCLSLERIPDGFRFILNLQKLTIIGMSELGKRVDNEEGEDFDKVRHVPSIIIDT